MFAVEIQCAKKAPFKLYLLFGASLAFEWVQENAQETHA
jgi:hypothetical protein